MNAEPILEGKCPQCKIGKLVRGVCSKCLIDFTFAAMPWKQ